MKADIRRVAATATLFWAVLPGSIYPTAPLHAQGGFPTNPYCAQYEDGTSLDCSFSTLSQCYQSVSGVGGVCIDNPRARVAGSASYSQSGFTSQPPPLDLPYAFAPAPAPPPPPMPAQGPLQLPVPQQQPAPAATTVNAPTAPCNPLIDGTYCRTANSNTLVPATIQSPSSDLLGGADPPATLGAINFSGSGGPQCIGLFRQTAC